MARRTALVPRAQRAVAGGEARVRPAQLGHLVLDAGVRVAFHHIERLCPRPRAALISVKGPGAVLTSPQDFGRQVDTSANRLAIGIVMTG